MTLPRTRTRSALLALVLLAGACSDGGVAPPADPLDMPVALSRIPAAPAPELAPAFASLQALQDLIDVAAAAGEIRRGDAESLSEKLNAIADKAADDKSDKSEKSEKSQKSGKSEKSDKSDKSGKSAKSSKDGDGPFADALKRVDDFLAKVDKLEGQGKIPGTLADALRLEVARLVASFTGQVTPEAGGTVVADGGNVLIDVPAGAVSTSLTLTATPLPDPVSAPLVLPGTVYDFGPDGTQFAVPVSVTLRYDPASVPDGLPAGAVYVVQDLGGTFERVPGPVVVDEVNGTVTVVLSHFSAYAVSADPCALRDFSLSVASFLDGNDCDFQGIRFNELYRVLPAALAAEAGQSFPGSPAITLTVNAEFDGVLGVKEAGPTPGAGRLYGAIGVSATEARGVVVVGNDAEYEVFIGGQNPTVGGAYTIDATVSPGGSFVCGAPVVLGGSADFSSAIGQGSACEGTIQFGPNVGQPLLYQPRYARLEGGKAYTVTLSGLAGAPAVGLFVARWPLSSGQDQELDLGGGPGDGERSLTFVPSTDGLYYIEVSTGDVNAPGAAYEFSFAEEPTYDPCALKTMDLSETANVSDRDCLFQGARYEDLYRLVTADLVQQSGQSFAGSPKITLTASTDFNGVMGFQAADPVPFEGLVHRFRNNLSAAGPVSFSMIGGEPEYKVFIGGLADTDFGRYTLTTDIAPGGEFSCGEVLVIAGAATFSSSVGESNACAGTIQFGPNVGQPLLYQPRYARLEAGKTYTFSIDGVAASAGPVTLFVGALPLSSGVDQILDFSDPSADTDRSITFTASQDGYYYLEVSTIPGYPSPYTLSFGPAN